jgi:tRNA 2-selenouridine synthase
MPRSLEIADFLVAGQTMPVLDVRSEGEYDAGHIPGAISLPLFDNAERAIVGTLYKKEGRQPAILKGLEFAGARISQMAQTALSHARGNRVGVHCWRGGMRSASVAWLLERVGLEVYVLQKGYKAYRRFCIDEFQKPRKLLILGGKTGSQKTQILAELKKAAANTIDLEGLAKHRGSAFGYLAEESQPTQEQFENALGQALANSDLNVPLIAEDESRLIGRVHIPDPFWRQMRKANVIVLEWPIEARVKHLTEIYQAPEATIVANLNAIQKRLGSERHRRAIAAIGEGRRDTVCEIVLDYYDRAYAHGLNQRDPAAISYLPGETAVEEILKKIK